MGLTISLMTMTSMEVSSQLPATHRAEHEFSFDGCNFKFIDSYNGRKTVASYFAIINPKAHQLFETQIQFSCNSATPKTYLDSASIKLVNGVWSLDLSEEDPRPPSPHTTLYLLHGKGWQGAGSTQDDTDGDEDRRTQTFGFCIPHNAYALCGMAQHVGYLNHLDESVLPQVINLLESIEFIDSPAAPVSSAPAR
jgi:hypothetical protein